MGGTSWQRLGGSDLGVVNDVAVGIDGRNLYAATTAGVWRLHLPVEPAVAPPPVRSAEDLSPDEGE
jgi:hypothetical protein